MKKAYAVAECFAVILVLQAALLLLRSALARLFPDTNFAWRMISMCIMALLWLAVVCYARLRKTPLSVFPARFGKRYIIGTVIAAALVLSAPSIFLDGYRGPLLMLYGSIVTPVYEETLFRGCLWNRLNAAFPKERSTFIWSVLLFAVWHLGYMLPHLVSGNWSAVLWKMAAGLGYGVVLGLLRLKTKNCYATMLLHAVLNTFMI